MRHALTFTIGAVTGAVACFCGLAVVAARLAIDLHTDPHLKQVV